MAKYDVLNAIMDYENGDLEGTDVLDLFSHLIKTGLAWTLQGSYGRAARDMIDSGYFTEDGEMTETTKQIFHSFEEA